MPQHVCETDFFCIIVEFDISCQAFKNANKNVNPIKSDACKQMHAQFSSEIAIESAHIGIDNDTFDGLGAEILLLFFMLKVKASISSE